MPRAPSRYTKSLMQSRVRYQTKRAQYALSAGRRARAHVVDLARTDTTVSRFSPGNFNGARNSFMPEEIRVKLIYNQTDTDIGLGVGATNQQIFRLSNPTDPDFSATGHQPMGYDELTSLYSKCHVVAAKITWQIFPADGSAFNSHIQVAGRPFTNNDTTPSARS